MLHIPKTEKKATYNESTKICSKCGLELPIEKFGRSSGAKYRRTECNSCNRELVRVRNELRKITPPPKENHTVQYVKKMLIRLKALVAKSLVIGV